MKVLVAIFVIFAGLNASFGDNVPSNPEIIPIDGGLSGSGVTTRYWDCCKPSCAWNIPSTGVKVPVTSCEKDGVTPISDEADSGCDTSKNGTAYSCSAQTAFVINSTLAYGFAAGSFVNGGGADLSMCCTCFLLEFQGQLLGKQMVVQITNTGSDLYTNQFDIAIPGAGVGIFTEGCYKQWNAPKDGWGGQWNSPNAPQQESDCDALPADLQTGCKYRFDFMEGVGNPDVNFYQVECPAELSAITSCVRADA